MKKKRKNSIDQLIENLAVEFSKIPNFDLTQNDPDGNRMFNLVISKFSEIQDFKTLFINYYIPKSNKAIVDAKNEIRKSIYKEKINITDEQLKENLYDVIRLGYVGLFHKIENFVKDFLKEANILLNENKKGRESLKKYFETNYNFSFYDWKKVSIVDKIGLICNCVKHNDSFPTNDLRTKYLNYLKEGERIRIDKDTFSSDIDFIINHFYIGKLRQIFGLGMFKMMKDTFEESDNNELNEKFKEIEKQINGLMQL
jgi:hypothetical protein